MFYLFLLAHLVADFVLQPYWLVVRKRHWDGLLLHGGIVLACMCAAAGRCCGAGAVAGDAGDHRRAFVADWWKVRYGGRIPGPPIMPIFARSGDSCDNAVCSAGSGAAGAADLDDHGIADGAAGAVCRRVCRGHLRHADRGDDLARPSLYERGAGRRARLRSLLAGAMIVSLTLSAACWRCPPR